MFEIQGKVALITGGAKGMGLSFARGLLKNGLKGVSLIDVDAINGDSAVLDLKKEFGTNCALFVKADITNESEFEDAFETTIKTFNQLDIVINNAGIAHEIQWRKCVAVNLVATITGSKLAMEKYLPKFKNGDEAVIINIASTLAIEPIEPVPVYIATKCGIVGFSRSIGGPVHYQKYKVRVLTICPGLTNTSMPGLSNNNQHEPFKSMMNDVLVTVPAQSPEDVAKNLIPILQEASSGSVWTIENGCRSLVEFPTYVHQNS